MSFDWLNVPGLSGSDAEQTNASEPPPPVSFDFGQFDDIKNNESTSHLDMNASVVDSSYNATGADYVETKEDLQAPLSLTRSQLTKEELKTYLRWYGYISRRKITKLIKLDDVFQFMINFPIAPVVKDRLKHIFSSCRNALNIGQFFAVVRLISHATLENQLPTRQMILRATPIPRPKPILAAGNEEVYEEVEDTQAGPESTVDFDSFAALLLTGEKKKRVRRRITNFVKKMKKVRFSENLVTFQDQLLQPSEDFSSDDEISDSNAPLDLSLPMDQLLKSLAARKKNSALVSKPPSEQVPESQEEKEVLEDMKESLNHFQQLHNVDSVAQGSLAGQHFPTQASNTTSPEPLKPTATGSANHLFRSNQPSFSQETLAPLKPTATGSANYLFRSSQPAPPAQQSLQPLKPTATGSANNLFRSRHQSDSTLNQDSHAADSDFDRPNSTSVDFSPASAGNGYGTSQPPHYQTASNSQNHLQVPDRYSHSYSLDAGTNKQQHTGLNRSPQNTSQDYLTTNYGNQYQTITSGSPSPMHINQSMDMSSFNDAMRLQQTRAGMLGQNSGGPFPQGNHVNFKPQPRSAYMHANHTGPSSTYPSDKNHFFQPRETHSFTPSPVPQMPYYTPAQVQGGFQSKDILGDLHALQAHVDQLQNIYKR
ncbi:LADA_0F07514g1_1 [Lachancea dasiensis]|uniref:LADA_0F07514g1_1 n=1 Tax=Lachancea dasiensis TaxID=1072105 RepID=A0A1G4JKB4_9SACH|nr:LADA_0F07514g1_1 [Lachancea dasiensis]